MTAGIEGIIWKVAGPTMLAFIVALIKYAWFDQKKRIDALEECLGELEVGGSVVSQQNRTDINKGSSEIDDIEKRLHRIEVEKGLLMGYKEHLEFCKEVREEQSKMITLQISSLKSWLDERFGNIDTVIEKKVLTEIRKLNGN